MHHLETIEGRLDATGLRFAILASRFNDFIVDRLVGGAVDYLVRHGAAKNDITLVRCPGPTKCPWRPSGWRRRSGFTASSAWAR
jgi:6,7-dimethyl-8-ribityllumazine synthase